MAGLVNWEILGQMPDPYKRAQQEVFVPLQGLGQAGAAWVDLYRQNKANEIYKNMMDAWDYSPNEAYEAILKESPDMGDLDVEAEAIARQNAINQRQGLGGPERIESIGSYDQARKMAADQRIARAKQMSIDRERRLDEAFGTGPEGIDARKKYEAQRELYNKYYKPGMTDEAKYRAVASAIAPWDSATAKELTKYAEKRASEEAAEKERLAGEAENRKRQNLSYAERMATDYATAKGNISSRMNAIATMFATIPVNDPRRATLATEYDDLQKKLPVLETQRKAWEDKSLALAGELGYDVEAVIPTEPKKESTDAPETKPVEPPQESPLVQAGIDKLDPSTILEKDAVTAAAKLYVAKFGGNITDKVAQDAGKAWVDLVKNSGKNFKPEAPSEEKRIKTATNDAGFRIYGKNPDRYIKLLSKTKEDPTLLDALGFGKLEGAVKSAFGSKGEELTTEDMQFLSWAKGKDLLQLQTEYDAWKAKQDGGNTIGTQKNPIKVSNQAEKDKVKPGQYMVYPNGQIKVKE